MQLSPALLARVRKMIIFTDATEAAIARQFGVSRRTAIVANVAELPKSRCCGCGGMVVLPCLLCHIREKASHA